MLRERLITALLLAPALLYVLLWGHANLLDAVIVAAMIVGAWEWARFCGWQRGSARAIYATFVAVAIALVWRYASQDALGYVWLGALLWWSLAFLWLAFAPQKVSTWTAAVAGVCVLLPAGIALIALSERRAMLLFVLVLIFAADIGAYFAGRTFGRLKLAPRVSPGKTWEGVIGGLLAALITALAGAAWFDLPRVSFVSLCLAVACVSIVGDLTESMFKRHVGLKDSSGLLPGHGGILDRIDSVTAAAPTFALGLLWMGSPT